MFIPVPRMRLLHTSDWHLGRLLHEASLLDDQAHALDQIVAMAKSEKPDLVVVAGDIYDRALPPVEAVSLLDETLARLSLDAGVAVLVIAGNHDSAERLQFGSRLLKKSGVTVVGRLSDVTSPLLFEDAHGPIEVYAAPYVEPAEARLFLKDDSLRGHDEAWRALLARVPRSSEASGTRAPRRILAAHAFVAGGLETESERPLSLGGSGAVGADAFAGFDYVALGHLHRPQQVGTGPLWYSGSLFKYAFSEAAHRKGALLVDIDAGGEAHVEALPFSLRRDVRRIEGHFEDLLRQGESDPARLDYVEAVLLDTLPQIHAMERLREAYPNALHIERPNLLLAAEGHVGLRGDHRRLGDLDLFREFMRQVHQREATGEEEQAFAVAAASLDADSSRGDMQQGDA